MPKKNDDDDVVVGVGGPRDDEATDENWQDEMR